MVTIGITGTIGAGKGTIVDFLVKEKGFKHYSVRNFLLEEIERRGIASTRDSMHLVADDFRRNYSPDHIMLQLLKERESFSGNAVIESQRAIAEIESLRKNANNFYLFAVDADPKIRYKRIVARKSSTDFISYEKFISDEESEMHNKEPWKMNLAACIKSADFVFENNSSVKELYKNVEKVLENLPTDEQKTASN